jgi:MFS family permease
MAEGSRSEFGENLRRPGRWYHEMTRYHWWILMVAALGWLFDTMDQTLFRLTKQPAIAELLRLDMGDPVVTKFESYAMSIFMIGWATGGLVFGILGDKWGRARTMLLTILLYSVFTGLSAFSRNWLDYSIYRFLTGLGVGGEFAAGAALVSEALPARARPFALGLLQALSAVGNIAGGIVHLIVNRTDMSSWISEWIGQADGSEGTVFSSWRIVMLAGVFPALMVVLVRRKLKEPESWVLARQRILAGDDVPPMGSIRELFQDRRWRRNALVGTFLAFAGVIGVWGVGFWSPNLTRGILSSAAENEREFIVSIQSILQDSGAFFGMLFFTWVATSIGRKTAFIVSFLLAYGVSTFVFGTMDEPRDIYWMIPMLGFAQLSVFGGFAIYFPELFPTRLRSTGTGFCYNVARYLAAVGTLMTGQLTAMFASQGSTNLAAFRYAAMTVLTVYFVGIVAVLFGPETKDKPLPT